MKSSVVSSAVLSVALRKESVDRNDLDNGIIKLGYESLSARRAWIEILTPYCAPICSRVALRKESVDRNFVQLGGKLAHGLSLSARRAWIEMLSAEPIQPCAGRRSPQGERG